MGPGPWKSRRYGSTREAQANDLGHSIEAIGIGQHLTVTVDDPEQAHGAESSILDPFGGLV